MFYLVSSGLPAAVALLKSGLKSGLISRALLVSKSPSPSLQVSRALLVWLGLLPSATCLGYVLPRISSSYFWDVTLVYVDGAFPRSLIIDHCLILAFQDSFDVTLACVDFVVSNCSFFRPTPTRSPPAALSLVPPAPDPRILVASSW